MVGFYSTVIDINLVISHSCSIVTDFNCGNKCYRYGGVRGMDGGFVHNAINIHARLCQ